MLDPKLIISIGLRRTIVPNPTVGSISISISIPKPEESPTNFNLSTLPLKVVDPFSVPV